MDPAHPMRQLFVMVAGFIIWPVASALLGAVLARYYEKKNSNVKLSTQCPCL